MASGERTKTQTNTKVDIHEVLVFYHRSHTPSVQRSNPEFQIQGFKVKRNLNTYILPIQQ
jgi:hypothetical protein